MAGVVAAGGGGGQMVVTIVAPSVASTVLALRHPALAAAAETSSWRKRNHRAAGNTHSIFLRAQNAAVLRRRRRSTAVCAMDSEANSQAASSSAASPSSPEQDTAGALIEKGIADFKQGKHREAYALFQHSLKLKPTTAESRAALYNLACCHVAFNEPDAAAMALKEAVRKHDLNLGVAARDPDMAAFRQLPQYSQLQREVNPLYIIQRVLGVLFALWIGGAIVYRLLVAAGVAQY